MPDETKAAAPQPTEFEKWDKLPEDEPQPAEAAKTPETPETPETPPTEPKVAAAAVPKVEGEGDDYDSLPGWAKKRIARQTTKIRDLQAAADSLKAATPQTTAAPAPAVAAEVEGEPVEPKLGDFATYDLYETAFKSYVKELARFEAKQIRAEEKAAESKSAAEKSQAAERAEWMSQVEDVTEDHPDFEEVALNPALPVSVAMFAVMRATPHGAELLYHLGKHPEVSAKIAALPAAAAALAIGKLEARLYPDDDEPPKKIAAVSRAPRPPQTVGAGGGRGDLGKEPDPKDFTAWSKWRDRQEAAEAA